MAYRIAVGWILILTAVSLVQTVAAECIRPVDPSNGEILSHRGKSFRSRYSLRFTCNKPHFRPIPANGRVICNGDQWEPRMQCVPALCSPFLNLPRGEVTYQLGSTGVMARFRCTCPGYRLDGERRLTCVNGAWSSYAPRCRAMEICPEPEEKENLVTRVMNGCFREGLWTFGSRYTFKCKDGHDLQPPATFSGFHYYPAIQCTRNGWNASLPTCVAITATNTVFNISETEDATNSLDGSGERSIGLPLSHNIGIELYFIFDASSTVGVANFESSKKFAKRLVREIGVTDEANSLRVGGMKYSSDAHVMFHTVEFDTTDEVVSAINAIEYGNGGGRNLAKVFDRLLNVMLPQSSALNRPGSVKIALLLSDGNPTEGGDSQEKARLVRMEGVTIMCIGVSEDANKDTLRGYASEPTEDHLFFLKDYRSLEELIKRITNQTVDYNECGISSRELSRDAITRKTPAKEGSWPWQVLLLIASGGTEHVCGGTLIKANWILTAANCFHEYDSVDVYVGLVERSEGYRYPQQEVKRIINHPEYHHPTKRYDIALIELERNVTLGPNVRTACLPDPTREDRLLHRGSAIVTGWGHIGVVQRNDQQESLIPEDALHELTLELHDPEECKASLVGDDEAHWFNKTVMTCAGYLNRQVGPCRGDSGGPLIKYAKQQNNNRRWTVIGVNSWGIGCALQNELDFFTNVPRLMPWINENINPPEDEVECETC